MGRTLLMADLDQLYRGIDQRVEDRHGCAARVAIDALNALTFKAADDHFTTGWDF